MSSDNVRTFERTLRAYLMLAAIVVAAHVLPFLMVRVPFGHLYISTDVPLHAAGVQRALCGTCFERDFFFIGDLRPLIERYGTYPLLGALAGGNGARVAAASWWASVLFNVIGVWAAYWTLVRLTGRKALSGGLSLTLLVGIQMLAGNWLGGMMGGYNTHVLAIALATWLFGAFVLTASGPDGGAKSLKYFYLCALAMNVYPLVFPHLMILMALYLTLRKLVAWKTLTRTLLISIALAPVAIADFAILMMRPDTGGLSDLREVHPFAYIENWRFFAAAGRRYLAVAAAIGVMALLKKRYAALRGTDHPARPMLVSLAWLSFNLTIASVVLEQFSPMAWRFQLSAAMSQWLLLALLFLAAHDVAVFRWPGRLRTVMSAGFVVAMFVLASNVFFTVRSVRDWSLNGANLRTRVGLYQAMRSLPPSDALFLSPPGRMATEARGFAGRGVVVAEKDRGAAQLDATKFHAWKELHARVDELYDRADVGGLKALARARGADYVIVSNVDLAGEDVVVQSGPYAVIRP